ncbi:uncharacterized protein LOC117638972 [Thrips palmi]|uniref:Uncharacterized protein LOC117638972 n=1 Tax=Thrips palmi TaxID=161013 RepID=A0A6P8XT90_THRPL|nr:uncharacterized protein LOC117638972 [Thrips palmi]
MRDPAAELRDLRDLHRDMHRDLHHPADLSRDLRADGQDDAAPAPGHVPAALLEEDRKPVFIEANTETPHMTAVDTDGRNSREQEDLDDEEAVVDIESTEDGDDVVLGEVADSPVGRVAEPPQVSPKPHAHIRPLTPEIGEEGLWAVATARLSLERRQEHLYRHLHLLRDGRDPLQPFKMGVDCTTCHQIYGPLLPPASLSPAEAKLAP